MLERLVYRSTARHDLGTLALFQLLTAAQLRNEQLQITGHLLYLDGQFTQCIEGPPESIEQLWQSLQRDERHHQIELLMRGPTEARRFSEWSMAFSTYASFYVHGLKGFFPVDDSGQSPLVPLCQREHAPGA
ncbi:BLUF domain-containing protein [Ideonella sp. 4Y11]|uniref:BLUF domain-containing protein n=2 Tax=Ideonella TaxID=36862 RepID=A0A941BLN8_9BURK|nr:MULTISPECIES: BLUF domain-containing protein [Ideonella]MBQ0933057.1 BLUF domain-containing protein [Ideonella alba]MBQ0961153.1 BLUF domain-containing protein [Ideonella aquatica]